MFTCWTYRQTIRMLSSEDYRELLKWTSNQSMYGNAIFGISKSWDDY